MLRRVRLWMAGVFVCSLGEFTFASPQTDSYYLNSGRNGTIEPPLGEFAQWVDSSSNSYDIGGFAPLYILPDPKRGEVKQYFFDLDQLLGPPSRVTSSNFYVTAPITGETCAFYLQGPSSCTPATYGTYQWEAAEINGGSYLLKWRTTPPTPLPRNLIVVFHGSERDPHKHFVETLPGLVEDYPDPDWPTRPLTLPQQSVTTGAYVLSIYENQGNDTYVSLQRARDFVYWAEHVRSPPLEFGGIYATGESWGGATANVAATLMPVLMNAVFGNTIVLDYGYDLPLGGWRKILGHMEAGLYRSPSFPIPQRTHSYPVFTAVSTSNRAADLIGSGKPELGALSTIQRHVKKGQVYVPVNGITANVDYVGNLHWSLPVIQLWPSIFTFWDKWQLLGHGDEGGEGDRFYGLGGNEIANTIASASANHENPEWEPSNLTPYPNPYLHTFTPPATAPVSPGGAAYPFLLDGSWNIGSTIPFIGQGIFPGAFDSLRVGNFDLDGATEVAFGNFDGFVHVMEVVTTLHSEKVLNHQWRSTPIGYNIMGLDWGNVGGGLAFIVCDSTGHLWRIARSGSSFANPVSFGPQIGNGYLQFLAIGEFSGSHAGLEVLLQEEKSTWVLLDNSGSIIGQTLRTGEPGSPDRFTGECGIPWKYDLDGDGDLELVAAGMDGFLRKLDFASGQLTVTIISNNIAACGRIVRVIKPNNGPNRYAIVGGVSRDLHRLYSVDLATGNVVSEYPPGSGDTLPAVPVGLEIYDDANQNAVLVAYGNNLQVLNVSSNGIFSLPLGGGPYQTIPGLPASNPPPSSNFLPSTVPEICSLEINGNYVYVSLPHGRIFILNKADLSFTRTTQYMQRAPGSTAEPWHANLTLAHSFGVADATDVGQSLLYVHDNRVPYLTTALGDTKYRIAALNPATGSMADWVLDGQVEASRPPRGLALYDNAGNIAAMFPKETGFVRAIAGQNYLAESYDQVSGGGGGYIFQGVVSPALGTAVSYEALQNFDVPKDPDLDLLPANAIGDDKRKGQITTNQSGATYLGHVLKAAMLPDYPSGQKLHYIAGTAGGFVYAIDPDRSYPNGLRYYTNDLGWNVIGMTVADLDNDNSSELLVGTWLDKGSFLDFDSGDTSKNRGHLYLLKPVPSATATQFVQTEIIPQEATGPFTSGVFGIRVDDIDGDGTPEIWAGDAIGYIYAFHWDTGSNTWRCFYRHGGIGVYAGVFNNIYPVKEMVSGKSVTTKLVVFTSGYVYRFNVLWDQVP